MEVRSIGGLRWWSTEEWNKIYKKTDAEPTDKKRMESPTPSSPAKEQVKTGG